MVTPDIITEPLPYGQLHNCQPTLDDTQVIAFCRDGYLKLDSVIDNDINRKVINYIEQENTNTEPTPIMQFDWFTDGILKHPQVAGAVRSLLGENFKLPMLVTDHCGPLPYECPDPGGGWHRDAPCIYNQLNQVQVFYYPQVVTLEQGPLEILPGSHQIPAKGPMMANYGHVTGALPTVCPAGTVWVMAQPIWHRRLRASAKATKDYRFRHLFKCSYWRTTTPQRDWKRIEGFDFSKADYMAGQGVLFEQGYTRLGTARLFCWLLGEQYNYVGGQSWPNSGRWSGDESPTMPHMLRRDGKKGV